MILRITLLCACLGILIAQSPAAHKASDFLKKAPVPAKSIAEARSRCPNGQDSVTRAGVDAIDAAVQEEMESQKAEMQKMQGALMASGMGGGSGDAREMITMSQAMQAFTGEDAVMRDSMTALLNPLPENLDKTMEQIRQEHHDALSHCPMLNSEAGRYADPSCSKPLIAKSGGRRDKAVAAYLTDLQAAWKKWDMVFRAYLTKREADIAHGRASTNPQIASAYMGQQGYTWEMIKTYYQQVAELTEKAAVALNTEYSDIQ